MARRLTMYLVDTNIWLEMLLEQERADDARQFLTNTDGELIAITEFSADSVGVILTRLGKDKLYEDFISDTLEDTAIMRVRLEPADLRRLLEVRKRFNLDFDDAYQYVAAERHGMTLVSFDADFDRTELGRRTPDQALGGTR